MKETGDKYRNFINLMIQELDNVADCYVVDTDFNGTEFEFKFFNKCHGVYYYFTIDSNIIKKINTRKSKINF